MPKTKITTMPNHEYWTCSAATFCDESSGTATCAPDVCEAGEPACDGETLAQCDEFGGGYVEQEFFIDLRLCA